MEDRKTARKEVRWNGRVGKRAESKERRIDKRKEGTNDREQERKDVSTEKRQRTKDRIISNIGRTSVFIWIRKVTRNLCWYLKIVLQHSTWVIELDYSPLLHAGAVAESRCSCEHDRWCRLKISCGATESQRSADRLHQDSEDGEWSIFRLFFLFPHSISRTIHLTSCLSDRFGMVKKKEEVWARRKQRGPNLISTKGAPSFSLQNTRRRFICHPGRPCPEFCFMLTQCIWGAQRETQRAPGIQKCFIFHRWQKGKAQAGSTGPGPTE